MKKIITLSNKEVTMREPKVRDIVALDDIDSEAQKEVMLIVNLAQLPEDEVMDMGVKDYRKLQGAAQDFLV